MTELFSEIYNCYFQVIQSLVTQNPCLSEKELKTHIQDACFAESVLYLLPRLTRQEWGFYEKRDGCLRTRLSTDFYVPLTNLQKAYIRAILLDDKIGLFLDEEEIDSINHAFA